MYTSLCITYCAVSRPWASLVQAWLGKAYCLHVTHTEVIHGELISQPTSLMVWSPAYLQCQEMMQDWAQTQHPQNVVKLCVRNMGMKAEQSNFTSPTQSGSPSIDFTSHRWSYQQCYSVMLQVTPSALTRLPTTWILKSLGLLTVINLTSPLWTKDVLFPAIKRLCGDDWVTRVA